MYVTVLRQLFVLVLLSLAMFRFVHSFIPRTAPRGSIGAFFKSPLVLTGRSYSVNSFTSSSSSSTSQRMQSRKQQVAGAGSASAAPYKAGLYQELNFWRKRTADELQQPVYRILSNKVIETITIHKPTNLSQLMHLSGVGPVKLQQFGERITDIVRNYCDENKVSGMPLDSEDLPNNAEFWEQYSPQKHKKASRTTSARRCRGADAGSALAGQSGVSITLGSKNRATKGSKENDSTSAKKKGGRLKVLSSTTHNDDDHIILISQLNQEQKLAAKAVLSGNNAFITGSAGTGKTFLMRYIIQELQKLHSDSHVAVTAPTGIAALNVGGQTIHSFAGIGLGKGDHDYIVNKVLKSKSALERWQRTKVLVIDEISMLGIGLFELLDKIARRTRNNSLPFGGIQLVVVGDFLQLPPVQQKALANATTVLASALTSAVHANRTQQFPDVFCFQSPVWARAGLNGRIPLASAANCTPTSTAGVMFHLQQIERQKDEQFALFLNQVRVGKYSREFEALLSNCLVSNKPKPSNGIIPTKLYAINKEVNAENELKLKELKGEVVTMVAEDAWKVKPSKPAVSTQLRASIENVIPARIDLKVGAQVMLLRNRISYGDKNDEMDDHGGGNSNGQNRGLANGSRGKIIAFTQSALRPGVKVPTVLFDNGVVSTVGPVDYVLNANGGDGVIVRSQIPLKLAWATTIHKSQGCTLTCAELILANTFDFGQVYVALSRVRDLKGLWLSTPIRPRSIKAHPAVLDFYEHNGASLTAAADGEGNEGVAAAVVAMTGERSQVTPGAVAASLAGASSLSILTDAETQSLEQQQQQHHQRPHSDDGDEQGHFIRGGGLTSAEQLFAV